MVKQGLYRLKSRRKLGVFSGTDDHCSERRISLLLLLLLLVLRKSDTANRCVLLHPKKLEV